MAHKTEIEVEITNATAIDSFFDRLKRQFGEWKKQGKEALSEMSKGTGDALTSGIGGLITSLGMDLLNTLIQPLSFSFSKAVESAKQYRTAVTDAALSTGKSFGEASSSIDQTSFAIGESHQTILSFSSAVQQTTGYWLEGTNAMEAYQDRAKFLGRSFGDMAKEASTLSQLFNLRDGDKISTFYETMNSQAAQLGVNAKSAAIQFDQLASSMARLTSASPEKISAISSAFLKAAGGNQAQASVIQQGFMNFIKPRISYIEDEMRATGQIKKNESILGTDGRIREDLMIPIVKMEQEYIRKHFEKEPWREQMRILGQGNVFGSSEAAAGFLNLDTAAMETASKKEKEPIRSSLQSYLQSEEGQRKLKDLDKEQSDRGIGTDVLGAQDEVSSIWSVLNPFNKVEREVVTLGRLHKTERTKLKKLNYSHRLNEFSNANVELHRSSLQPLDDRMNQERKQVDASFAPRMTSYSWVPQSSVKESKAPSVYQSQIAPSTPLPPAKRNKSRPMFHWSGTDKEPVLSKENQDKIRKLLPEDIKDLAKQFGDHLLSRTLKVQVIPDAPPEPVKPPRGEKNHG